MYLANKYTRVYYQIIDRAKSRNFLSRKDAVEKIGYVEKHHVIPKSLGGTDEKENLVFLSGREHFICHWLLIKMTIDENLEKMIFALNGMKRKGKKQNRYETKITSRVYSIIKEKASEISSKRQIGIKQTPESNKKRSDTQTGQVRGSYNKTIYKFCHYDGRVENCTMYELTKKYGVPQGNLSKLAKSPVGSSVYGWSLNDPSLSRKAKQAGHLNPQHDSTIRTFIHSSGVIEVCTQYDLYSKYKLQKTNINALVKGKQKTAYGWRIL